MRVPEASAHGSEVQVLSRTVRSLAALIGVVVVAVAAFTVVLSQRPTIGGPAGQAPEATASRSPLSGAIPTPASSTGPESEVDAATAPAPVHLVGAGDIATCNSDGAEQTAKLLDSIKGTVFTLGDNAYDNGSKQEYASCYDPTWGRHLDRTRPAPGNHEYNTAGAAGYFGYFGDRAGPGTRGYYAYTRGAWRIYALNSNCTRIGGCGKGSAELRWLKADLAAHPSKCVLAYWHHPRYSSGEHGNNTSMDAIWDTLYRGRVELVLAGHDHDYERFAPKNDVGKKDVARGITSFVVGSGGTERFYRFTDIKAGSVARQSNTWGVLRLTLSTTGWSSQFIPVAGGTYTDTASGACR